MNSISNGTRAKFEKKKLLLEDNKAKIQLTLAEGSRPKDCWTEICRKSVTQLHTEITHGSLKIPDVLKAFQTRCKKLESRNFLADYILEANKTAEKVASSDSSKNCPLYGVPISLKDCFAIKGYDASMGLIKTSLSPQEQDSVLYKVLVHCGAIPFITTSMAQGGLSIESSSPLFGEQSNAFFDQCISGGSSGGEGLAVSLDASPIGVGTDIGGSVRFPAAFNGICGLRPTHRRISTQGMVSARKIPSIKVTGVPGPIGRSVDDLAAFMRAILCSYHFDLDPTVVPLVFNESLFSGKQNESLKIGFYTEFGNGMLDPVPSVKRAIKTTANTLRNLGYHVIEFKFPQPEYTVRLFTKAILHDSGKNIVDYCKDELLDKSAVDSNRIFKIPTFLRRMLLPIASKFYGEQIRPGFQGSLGLSTGIEVAMLTKEIHTCINNFLEEMGDLDVILCPLFPGTVPKKSMPSIVNNCSVAYSAVYNLLDLPAGVVNVTRTNQDDLDEAKRLSEAYRGHGDKMNATVHEDQTVIGLPVPVQIVAKPFKEELVLRVMKMIEGNSDYKRSIL